MIKKLRTSILFLLITGFLLLASAVLSAEDLIYWEKERIVATDNIDSCIVKSGPNYSVLIYTKKEKSKNLYLRYSTDGLSWSNENIVTKKLYKNNNESYDFDGAISKESILYICYRSTKYDFIIIKIDDIARPNKQSTFTKLSSDAFIYLPKLYIDSFDYLNILYATNTSKKLLLEYRRLDSNGDVSVSKRIGEQYRSSINPVIKEHNQTIYIIFQSKDETLEVDYYYNITMASSRDFGRNWEYKHIIQTVGENNQGPDFTISADQLYLTWEREDKDIISHIFFKKIDLTTGESSEPLMISDINSEAHAPRIINNNGIFVFWYDNYKKTYQNYYAHLIDDIVDYIKPVGFFRGRTLTNHPLVFKNETHLLWVQAQNTQVLYQISEDKFVNSPTLSVKGIKNKELINKNNFLVSWKIIQDISGVEGYRSLITQDETEKIPENITAMYYTKVSESFTDLADGTWYYKIKAYDNAGNASAESVFSFTIDTKPPPSPIFTELNYDEEGGLETNSPRIEWTSGEEELVRFQYMTRLFIGKDPEDVADYPKKVTYKDFKNIDRSYTDFNNLDNGTLIVGIRGFDRAGNVSEPIFSFYKLNDYVPVTYISYLNPKKLETGDIFFNISGRGFSIGGLVDRLIIDKDKEEPFDYELNNTYFRVITDRFIAQSKAVDIEDGTYYIGVRHPERGIKFYKVRYRFSGDWVFKFEHENYFSFEKVIFLTQKYNLSFIFLIAFLIFFGLIVLMLFRTIIVTIGEKVYINRLIRQLETIKTNLNDEEYFSRRTAMKRRGLGLTVKYTILILALVIIMVSGTSITISALALRNETRNLAIEMKERSNLVIRNFETTMIDIYTFEKGYTEAVDASGNISGLPDIGFVYYRDKVTKNIRKVIRYGEKSSVFFKGFDFELMSDTEKNEIIESKSITPESEKDIENFLTDYKGESKIYPDFDPVNLQDNYIFLKPVIIEGESGNEHVADLFIGYSFEKILKLINDERIALIKLAGIVTVIAIILSLFGAIFLATTTIRPIRRMSRHVDVIAKSDDYEKLVGTEHEHFTVKTRDEIGLLASSINDMTEKLIEKAKADKQTMLGKEIQKKFIPLEPFENDYIDLYGFYNGAKGVSGDYFDFKKLDDDHMAFIICDVAGKAVPAALIMVQISTIFQSFCVNFDPKRDKFETVGIVNTINDTVAERGFTGRFAAILVVIYNIKTGKALLTNAGYTQLLVYRTKLGKAEWIKLDPNSGAAGVFPSFMLPHPYVQENLKINKGDVIFLFTDGIEESRNGKTIITEEGEEQPEEFGLKRIKDIADDSAGKNPRQIVNDLMEAEKIFRGDLEQYDDLTVLAVQRK